jgi:hypothetical protein
MRKQMIRVRTYVGAAFAATALAATFLTASPAGADPTYPLDGCPNLVEGSGNTTCVKYLQQELDQYYGFTLSVDGGFGPLTEAALVAFQQKAGISADGQAGPQTQAALQRDSAEPNLDCAATMQLQPNYQGGPENDFGAALDLYIVDPVDYSGSCEGWVVRSVNGGPFQRVSQVYSAPSNGGDQYSPYEWDGMGAKTEVCVDSNGNVACSAPF